MPLNERVRLDRGRETGSTPERRYFTAIGLYNVKTIAYRNKHANHQFIITSLGHEHFMSVHSNDFN